MPNNQGYSNMDDPYYDDIEMKQYQRSLPAFNK